jgi:multidrug resistance efflux pump
MKLSDFLSRIRPRDRTSGSAAEALATCEAEIAAAQARLADMEQRRPGALLDLPADAAAAFESDLATARGDVERLGVLQRELVARRDQAAQAERRVAAEAAHAEAERLASDAAAKILEVVPQAVDSLTEALEAERRALEAIDRATQMARGTGIDRPSPVMPLTRLVGRAARLRDVLFVADVESQWSSSYEPQWALNPRR